MENEGVVGVLGNDLMRVARELEEIMKDIENGHEPHDKYYRINQALGRSHKEGKGRRMTQKIVKERLRHLRLSIQNTVKRYDF